MSTAAWTLRGGTIIDGTGRPGWTGSLVVQGDRVTAVGQDEMRGHVIDVAGHVVAPGFIDIHSHDDWIAPLPEAPELLGPNVQQGITTTAAGNCGLSPAPLRGGPGDAVERMNLAAVVADRIGWRWNTVDEFFRQVEQRGLPLNLCMYVGHSTVRAAVMGDAERPPTPRELAAMQELLGAGLRDGAVGLSIGLEYFPGRYASTSEIQALASGLPGHDALLAAHTRGISGLYDMAMAEAIGVAERSGCRLQLAHVNPMGRANWDAIDPLFERVDAARGRGLDVGYDIVTYVGWTLTVFEILPYFVQDLGRDAAVALASTGDGRLHLRRLIERARPVWPSWIEHRVTRNIILDMGWDALLLADPASRAFLRFKGESIGGVARAQARDPYDVYFDLLVASEGRAQIVNVGYGGDFEDEGPLHRLIARPDAIPETDTVPVQRPDGHLHLNLPLFYGTMARFLGRFSRDLGLLRLEDAIHRMTELPARRLRLRDRGVLREGAYADITVFDPKTIGDRGTYLDPQPAGGIVHVFVNGQPVVQNGRYHPDRLAGRVLRRMA
jgi:N-acyl-D-aspartate/D-glutamate deacylase